MERKKILFVCGSLNQTTQMHQVSRHLDEEYDCFFTPYFCDGVYRPLQKLGLLDFTIIGGQNRRGTEKYFETHDLKVDYAGATHQYALALTCTDLIWQKNLEKMPTLLIQEGMTDPENFLFQIVKALRGRILPRWIASTSTTGLSHQYAQLCVASEGYRRLFIRKGVPGEKIVVTGIPNFDNSAEFLKNDFPHHGHVLVATTDTRENFKWDNRPKFIKKAVELAEGRQLIFRLHPNEDPVRARREIKLYAPGALVYDTGNTSHMIANCHTLITQFSSVVYVGLALGKRVYSYFDLDELKELLPIQNGGSSAKNIAQVCRQYL